MARDAAPGPVSTRGGRHQGLARLGGAQPDSGGREGGEAAPLPASPASPHRLGWRQLGSGASTGKTFLTGQQKKTQPGSQLQSLMQVRRALDSGGPAAVWEWLVALRPGSASLPPDTPLGGNRRRQRAADKDRGCCPPLWHCHSVREARGTQGNKEKMHHLIYIRREPEGEVR